MKERISITINDLDDIKEVFKSVEILFKKIILYYENNDKNKSNHFLLTMSVWFGIMLQKMGYTEDDFK